MRLVARMLPRAWFTVAIDVIYVFVLLTPMPISALKCLQCTSVVDAACRTGSVRAEPCPHISTDKYCVKYVGYLVDRDEVTNRHCSGEKIRNGCHYRNLSRTHMIEVCYWSCSTDGCNSANAPRVSILSDIVFVHLIVLFVNYRLVNVCQA